jgi:hypothetical protein
VYFGRCGDGKLVAWSMANSFTKMLKDVTRTSGICRVRATLKASSGKISINFVFGGARNH